MHRNILLATGGLVYYALASYALYIFQAELLFTSIVLFGIPAYLLARYSAAPSAVLMTVVALGAGIALLLEGLAHIYGIWYSLGVDSLRIFGLIPLEVVGTTILQTIFLALLYELVFDDGIYTTSSARVRFGAFGLFALSVVALIAVHQYIVDGIFFSHSYVWILSILIVSSIAALMLHKRLRARFIVRLSIFSLIAAIPLLLSTILTILNTHKVFAFVHDYLATVSIGSEIVPIEEFVMVLVLPLFVATFYELYLDDAEVKN